MKRLIDADAIINTLEIAKDAAIQDKKWGKMQGLNWAIAEIRDTEPVEAIPIGWIRNRMFDMMRAGWSTDECAAIAAMLVDWDRR